MDFDYKQISKYLPLSLRPNELNFDITEKLFLELAAENSLSKGIIDVFDYWLAIVLPNQITGTPITISSEIKVVISNVRYRPPYYKSKVSNHEKLIPKRCRNQSETYFFEIIVDAKVLENGIEKADQRKDGISFGKMPLMLGTKYCHTRNQWIYNEKTKEWILDGPTNMDKLIEMGECPNDPLGYFIINGTEKVITIQERLRTSINITYPPDSKDGNKTQATCVTPIGTSVVLVTEHPKFQTLEVRLDGFPKKYKLGVFSLFDVLGYTPDSAEEMIMRFIPEKEIARARFKLSMSKFMGQYEMGKDDKNRKIYIRNILTNPATKIFRDSLLLDDKNNKEKTQEIITTKLREIIFANVEKTDLYTKAIQLAMISAQHLRVMMGWRFPDKRDDWGNKRLESAGDMMKQLFNEYWDEAISHHKTPSGTYNIISLIESSVKSLINSSDSSFNPNSWGVKKTRSPSHMKENVTDNLKRETATSVYSQVGRINTPISRRAKQQAIRMLQKSQLGFICIGETPEGETCGLVKNLATTCRISSQTDLDQLGELLAGLMDSGNKFSPHIIEKNTSEVIDPSKVIKHKVPIGTVVFGEFTPEYVALEENNVVGFYQKNTLNTEFKSYTLRWVEVRVAGRIVYWKTPNIENDCPLVSINRRKDRPYVFCINGIYHGWVNKDLMDQLRDARRQSLLPSDVCVNLNEVDSILEFFSDGERPMRSLIRLDENGQLPEIFKEGVTLNKLRSEGWIELIDAREQGDIFIAMDIKSIDIRKKTMSELPKLQKLKEHFDNKFKDIDEAKPDIIENIVNENKDAIQIVRDVIVPYWTDILNKLEQGFQLDEDESIRLEILMENSDKSPIELVTNRIISLKGSITGSTRNIQLDQLKEKILFGDEDAKERLKDMLIYDTYEYKSLMTKIKIIAKMTPYQYSEINPISMFGVAGCLAPKAEHQQGPRTTYQISMCKQALGGYHYNHALRFETYKTLPNATRAIFETSISELAGLNTMPTGYTPIIAFYAMNDNNEDAITVKEEFVKTGTIDIIKYTVHKDKISTMSGQLFEIPERKEQEIKADNPAFFRFEKKYADIEPNGLPKIGAYKDHGDIIIAKTIKTINPITKEVKKDNISLSIGVGEGNSYVDSIYRCEKENTVHVKIKTRQTRESIEGDKNASRYSQKGTISNIIPSHKIIRVQGGPNDGLVPDFIINPKCIPSRMTIGKPIEVITSKAACLTGSRVNGSTFNQLDIDYYILLLTASYAGLMSEDISKIEKSNDRENLLMDLLREKDLDRKAIDYPDLVDKLKLEGLFNNGMESVILPDGTPIKDPVFIGPCNYQALRHHVLDKIQMRGHRGAIKMDVRQPVKGRTLEGGIRFGEMERDGLISHGATSTLLERLFYVADPYRPVFCRKCGQLATPKTTAKKSIYNCRYCSADLESDFGNLDLPYVMKYISHMILGLGFGMFIATKSAFEDGNKAEYLL